MNLLGNSKLPVPAGQIALQRVVAPPIFCLLLLWLALIQLPNIAGTARFDPAKLAQMETEIQSAIAKHQLPGAVLWVESRGSNFHKAFGWRAIVPAAEPMTEDTIFDMGFMHRHWGVVLRIFG